MKTIRLCLCKNSGHIRRSQILKTARYCTGVEKAILPTSVILSELIHDIME